MGMALDEPQENEQPVNVQGVKFLIDDSVMPFLDGAKVDYDQYIQDFTITGPEESC